MQASRQTCNQVLVGVAVSRGQTLTIDRPSGPYCTFPAPLARALSANWRRKPQIPKSHEHLYPNRTMPSILPESTF